MLPRADSRTANGCCVTVDMSPVHTTDLWQVQIASELQSKQQSLLPDSLPCSLIIPQEFGEDYMGEGGQVRAGAGADGSLRPDDHAGAGRQCERGSLVHPGRPKALVHHPALCARLQCNLEPDCNSMISGSWCRQKLDACEVGTVNANTRQTCIRPDLSCMSHIACKPVAHMVYCSPG